jgi:hypothetical protein
VQNPALQITQPQYLSLTKLDAVLYCPHKAFIREIKSFILILGIFGQFCTTPDIVLLAL